MSGLKSRDKGKRAERACVALLKHVYPLARRSAQSVQDRSVPVPDVEGTPWWIECGILRTGSLDALLLSKREQAAADRQRAGDKRPLLIMARVGNGSPWWCAFESSAEAGGFTQAAWCSQMRAYSIEARHHLLVAVPAIEFLDVPDPLAAWSHLHPE